MLFHASSCISDTYQGKCRLIAVVLKHRHVVLMYQLSSCATMINLEVNHGTAYPPVVLGVLQCCHGEGFALPSCSMVRYPTTSMSSHLQCEHNFCHHTIRVHLLTDGVTVCACSDVLPVNMKGRKQSTERMLVKRSK